MIDRIKRLFIIKDKFEAYLVIFGLAMGATERGAHYMQLYPGAMGWIFFTICPIAVFMAGVRILDSLETSS